MTKMMIVEINPPPSFHEIRLAKHPRPGPSISFSFGPYLGSFSLSDFFSSLGGSFFSVFTGGEFGSTLGGAGGFWSGGRTSCPSTGGKATGF